MFLHAALRANPQARPPDAASEPLILKSASHAVQLNVVVTDPSGNAVHGLQKNDFVVTDDGRPRDIRIFAGEIDVDQTAPSATTMPPPGVYSNRVGMRDSRMVTVIVIDAEPRPDGLQKNAGRFGSGRPGLWFAFVRSQAERAIYRMQPGQTMAIYAACPDLRIVQDYTSDPDRLAASLSAFVPPPLPKNAGKKQPQTIDALVPPMLSALRDAAARMSEASGRKSVVWISQAYGTELNLSAVSDATDATIHAFNDRNIPIYAVDARFSPTCEGPPDFSNGVAGSGQAEQGGIFTLTCSQPPDVSDEWMQYLAKATGGRAFSGGKVTGIEERYPPGPMGGRISWRTHRLDRDDGGLVSDALRFASDDSRYAYVMGFYVPESEIDGKVHTLSVTLPGKPKFGVRYRSGYTAAASATALPEPQELAGQDSKPESGIPPSPDEVGIDARVDLAAKNELRVSLALAPATVTRAASGMAVLDATFTQTNESGKQLAKIEETVEAPWPGMQTEMVRYSRAMKLSNGAVLLHIRVRDAATGRAGSIAIPIGKQ